MIRLCRNMLLASILIGLALVGLQAAVPLTLAQEVRGTAGLPATQPATRPVPEVKIDMDKAISVELPGVSEALKPAASRPETANRAGS